MTIVIFLSFILLYINTFFSRYANVNKAISQGFVGDLVIYDMSANLLAKFLIATIYLFIFILFTLNIKKILTNRKVYLYFLIILFLPYLLLISENSSSYLLSLSSASKLMAPGTIFSISLFFLVKDDEIWNGARNGFILIWLTSLVLSVIGVSRVLLFIYTTPSYLFRLVSLKWLWAPMIILEFTYLIPLSLIKNKFFKIFMFILSVSLLLFCAILTQTRLVIVMSFLNAIIYSLIIGKKNVYRLIFVSLLILAFIYTISFNDGVISMGLSNFIQRLLVDTRTSGISQIWDEVSNNFFKYFPLGGGYGNERLFTDLGYLNAVFVAGIPMVFFVTLLLYRPIFRLFRKRKFLFIEPWILSAALMWCFRSQISSMMAFTTEFLMFILVAGRCSTTIDKDFSNKNTTLNETGK